MYNTVEKLLYFITASPQRLQTYITHAANTDAPLLKKFCETRWTHRSESVDQVITCFSAIIDTLQSLSEEKLSHDASSFLHSVLTFDFIICLHISNCLLKFLMPLCNVLQAKNCDLVQASQQAQTLVTFFQKKREDDTYDCVWTKACEFATNVDVSPKAPRTTPRQTQRSNTPAHTPMDYWRLNVYLPFLDHIITQLSDRLCKPLPRLCAQYILPDFIDRLTADIWQNIKEEYEPLLPSPTSADVELEVWRHYISTTNSQLPATLPDAVIATRDMYPNIHAILRTLLTMPVSTATAERSFSTLRQLKTYLRTKMTDQPLTSLALLHIHREIDVDVNAVIKEFDATGNRRLCLD